MTRQVALAESTYARLRRSRHPGESFSKAIDRLLDGAKDPMGFVKRLPKADLTPEEHLRMIEEDRNSDWVDF
ncbi:MAG: antitoxin VapB family protein [Candidatus Thermoplasmatota archaeon]